MKQTAITGKMLIGSMNNLKLSDSAVALWFLGQSGFAVKGGNRIVYFDPYLSDYLVNYTRGRPDEDPRNQQPPLRPEDVTNANLVLCSHNPLVLNYPISNEHRR